MGFLYTTSDLLDAIKDRAHIPDAQTTYSAARLLNIATDELLTYIVPLVLSTQEDYYVTSRDYAASGTRYTLPNRAVGGKLKDVVLINATGDEIVVNRIERSQRSLLTGLLCWLEGNTLVFNQDPSPHTVKIYYHIRPNRLCETSQAPAIVNVSGASVEVGVLPATFTVGSKCDVVSQNDPHWITTVDAQISAVSAPNVTFSTTVSASQGDYLSLAGTSPVVQCPYELVPLLAQKVACKVMESEGDMQGLQASMAELTRMERAAMILLQPRIDSQSLKIIHRGSDLRGLPRRWGYINRS